MQKYRIVCANNSDARGFNLLDGVASSTRHNGGKVVICMVDADDAPEAERILDASHKVASYPERQTMTESKIQIALSTVKDIATYAAQGNEPMARSSRKTLNELCCVWSDELGAMSYLTLVRDALRAAGLREVAS